MNQTEVDARLAELVNELLAEITARQLAIWNRLETVEAKVKLKCKCKRRGKK
jgi:hypothetical protein